MTRLVIFSFLFVEALAIASEQKYSVHIVGNKKTQDSYVEKLFSNCIEQVKLSKQKLTEIEALEQCMLNTKLFSSVKITFQDSHYLLTLKEKWTLIPVPLATLGSGNTRKMGILVFESNFLGLGHKFALAALRENDGRKYFMFYRNTNVYQSNWDLAGAAKQTAEGVQLIEGDEVTDETFEEVYWYNIGVGYNYYRLFTRLHMSRQTTENIQVEGYKKHPDGAVSRGNITAKLDLANYKYYFNEGLQLQIDAGTDLSRTNNQDYASWTKGEVNFAFSPWRKHALILMGQSAFVSGGGIQDIYRVGAQKGFRGTESESIWAERFSTISADYMIPITDVKIGTWTYGNFFDFGVIKNRGGKNSTIRYHSWGFGTYVFLKEVAIPGVGFEFGRNNRYQQSFIKLAVGLQL